MPFAYVIGGPDGEQQSAQNTPTRSPSPLTPSYTSCQRPSVGKASTTIDIARGLRQASGPKRAVDARQAGLILLLPVL
jgi:hypothetical protein